MTDTSSSSVELEALRVELSRIGKQSDIKYNETISDADRLRDEKLKARREFFDSRRKWSLWLRIWISVQLAFQVILTFAIAFFDTRLDQNGTFLNIVTIQTLVQIVGMSLIIVTFYFKNIEF